MKQCRGPVLIALLAAVLTAVSPAHAEAPAGQITWAVPVSLPPAWLPSIKGLVLKSVPDETTRLAMLKRGKSTSRTSCGVQSPRKSSARRGSR